MCVRQKATQQASRAEKTGSSAKLAWFSPEFDGLACKGAHCPHGANGLCGAARRLPKRILVAPGEHTDVGAKWTDDEPQGGGRAKDHQRHAPGDDKHERKARKDLQQAIECFDEVLRARLLHQLSV